MTRPSFETITKKQKEKRAEKAIALEAKEAEIAAPGIVFFHLSMSLLITL